MFLRSVDVLHQFYRSSIDLDKGYDAAIAWAVRLNYDVLASVRISRVLGVTALVFGVAENELLHAILDGMDFAGSVEISSIVS